MRNTCDQLIVSRVLMRQDTSGAPVMTQFSVARRTRPGDTTVPGPVGLVWSAGVAKVGQKVLASVRDQALQEPQVRGKEGRFRAPTWVSASWPYTTKSTWGTFLSPDGLPCPAPASRSLSVGMASDAASASTLGSSNAWVQTAATSSIAGTGKWRVPLPRHLSRQPFQ